MKIFELGKHNMRQENKKIGRYSLLAAATLLVLLLVVLVWFVTANKKFTPDAEVFRYCMGTKLTYTDNMKLTHTDAATYIEDEDKVASDGTPLMYEGELKMVLPVSMGYLNPAEDEGVKRVNYFATLSREHGVICISYNGIVTEKSGGFLYDGSGTYVFLEPMTITIGESSYEVAPLTYAKEVYKNCVEIYDCNTEEYQYVAIVDTDAIASSAQGYSVNLGTGVMTTNDRQRILFSDIDAMGALE